jgi:RNA polymerase sigma-70 factor, ECF subfamily
MDRQPSLRAAGNRRGVAVPETLSQQEEEGAAGTDLAASYREFRQGLLAFLRGKLGDVAVAEDLLQEVFLKALSALDRGAKPGNIAAWLRTIAANTLIDYYRTRRPTQDLPADLASEPPGRSIAEREMAECLLPFINGLPPIYRDVLYPTVLEGRTATAVARELGLSDSAVKSRLSRGRRLLRAAILDCCHVEVAANGEILEYRRRARQQKE